MSKILNTQEFLKENVETINSNQITFGFEKNDPRIRIGYDPDIPKENTVELEFRCYTEGNIKGFGKSGMPLEIQFRCVFNVTFLDENNYDITLEENNFYCDNSDIVTPCCMSANICFGGIDNIKNSLLANAYKEDVERIFRIFPNPESLKIVSDDRITIFPSKETVDTFFDDCMTRFAEYIKETIEENLNK